MNDWNSGALVEKRRQSWYKCQRCKGATLGTHCNRLSLKLRSCRSFAAQVTVTLTFSKATKFCEVTQYIVKWKQIECIVKEFMSSSAIFSFFMRFSDLRFFLWDFWIWVFLWDFWIWDLIWDFFWDFIWDFIFLASMYFVKLADDKPRL